MADELDRLNRRKRVRRKASMISRDWMCYMDNCTKSYGSEGALKNHFRLKHHDVPYQRKKVKRLPTNDRDADDESDIEEEDDDDALFARSYSGDEEGEGVLSQLTRSSKRRSIFKSDGDSSPNGTNISESSLQLLAAATSKGSAANGYIPLGGSTNPPAAPSMVTPSPISQIVHSQQVLSNSMGNAGSVPPLFPPFSQAGFGLVPSMGPLIVPRASGPTPATISQVIPQQTGWSFVAPAGYAPFNVGVPNGPTPSYLPGIFSSQLPMPAPNVQSASPQGPPALVKADPDVNK
jgi:hypothetical protein